MGRKIWNEHDLHCEGCEICKKAGRREGYEKGINDLLKKIETHYFRGGHYYEEVKELADCLKQERKEKSEVSDE